MVFITGFRGTGKTTLLLQKLQEYDLSKVLYITADSVDVASKGIFEIALEFEKYGGKHLVIDEVQKYPNWI